MTAWRTWRTWRGAAATLAVSSGVVLAGCGGGSGSSLNLEGLKIPKSQVVNAVSQMCTVAKQSHTDPSSANNAFYGGPHDSMHLLAAVLAPNHKGESNNLLSVMVNYETDIGKTPPPPTTGADADALLKAAQEGLTALKIPVPPCS